MKNLWNHIRHFVPAVSGSILLLLALLRTEASGFAGAAGAFAVEPAAAQLYVSPRGDDSNAGTSEKTPFKTIQHALDVARPGTQINLDRGIYREQLTTKIAGTEEAPIVIRGTDDARDAARRHQTVLYGTGRIVNIDHSFYRLEGFAINGQEALAGTVWPEDPAQVIAFKDANQSKIKDGRLIYIGSDQTSREITGVKISNMYLRGAGGEAIRIRNASHHNEISGCLIEYCGLFGKKEGAGFAYHNGEGVYIGTSPKSTSQPMAANDTSSYNTVRDSIIHTYGSEAFNIKENAHDNALLNNECKYNLEPVEFLGSNIELRGDHNRIEGNRVSDSDGWNLKIKSDSARYDLGGNVIRNNQFSKARGANIRNDSKSVTFCGNTVDGEVLGTTRAEVTAPCTD